MECQFTMDPALYGTGAFKKEKRTSKKTTAKEVDDVGKKKTKKRK